MERGCVRQHQPQQCEHTMQLNSQSTKVSALLRLVFDTAALLIRVADCEFR